MDLYAAFSNDARFSEAVGTTDSLCRADSLHPRLATGDDLIALTLADALVNDIMIPEPATGLLVVSGLGALVIGRHRATQLQ